MPRVNALEQRHRDLGCNFDGDSWNDMAIPWRYQRDLFDEVVATRTRAGLYDVTMVNLVDVGGPDAEAVLDAMLTIDVPRMPAGSARIAAEVSPAGGIVDDIMVIRDAADRFRLSHGSGSTPDYLRECSKGRRVSIVRDDNTNVLSLQGPRSRAILGSLLPFDLATLPYFHHRPTELFGRSVIVARGGYSGELGYEIYCSARDAVAMWDGVLESGATAGLIPCAWNALEATRIEAALLYYPFEMCEGDTTPWEVNMPWAVDLDKKADYIGKAAVLSLRGRERVKQAGVVCQHGEAVAAGSRIFVDDVDVGVVTTAGYSEYLMQSLAMVHLLPRCTAIGTRVTIRSATTSCTGYVAPTPFYDPLRLRTHPEKRGR